jgi:hypothetical protein
MLNDLEKQFEHTLLKANVNHRSGGLKKDFLEEV